MIPGMSEMMGGNEGEATAKMRRMAFIFDSMSTAELDSDGGLFRDDVASTSKSSPSENGKEKALPEMTPREPNKRVLRVARGSGTSVDEVEEVLAQHQMFSGMVKRAGGKSGWSVPSPFSLSRSRYAHFFRPTQLKYRMTKMQQQAQRGGAGAAGRPALGPSGMPDLSKLSPGQMAQMQVRPASFLTSLVFLSHVAPVLKVTCYLKPEYAAAGDARADGSTRRDGANAANDAEHGRNGRNGRWNAWHARLVENDGRNGDGWSMNLKVIWIFKSCCLPHRPSLQGHLCLDPVFPFSHSAFIC